MTRQPELRAINCSNCGAGLSVIGGGRVTTHVCGYCGSALDALENYRVLQRFASVRRPETALPLGAEGRLWGERYRVIGIIEEEEHDEGRTWKWVNHFLFSETHGYAWITDEGGHLTWSRRFRKPTEPAWVDPRQADESLRRPVVEVEGERFTFLEASESRITFVEGEFTWRPFVGDATRTATFKSATRLLHFTEAGTEREVEIGGHLNRERTLADFGVRPRAADRHAVQRDDAERAGASEPADNTGFVVAVSGACAAACLIGALFMLGGGDSVLPQTIIQPGDLPAAVTIPVDEPHRLMQLDVEAQVSSGWAWIEFDLEDPEGAPVFIAGREVGFYTGYDADGSWTEDVRRTRLLFRPEVAGDYTLQIAVDEAGLGDGDVPDGPIPALSIEAAGGRGSPFWLTLAGLGFAALAAWKLFAQRSEWRGIDT